MLNKLKTWLERPGTGCTSIENKDNTLTFVAYGESQTVAVIGNKISCNNFIASGILRRWFVESKENNTLPFVIIGEDNLEDHDDFYFCNKNKLQKITSIDELGEFVEWCKNNNLECDVDENTITVTENIRGTGFMIEVVDGQADVMKIDPSLGEKQQKARQAKVDEISRVLGINKEKAKAVIKVIEPNCGGKSNYAIRLVTEAVNNDPHAPYVFTDKQIVRRSI